jgi:hypothetical protein
MDAERMSVERRWWRGAAGAFALLMVLGAPGSTVQGQGAWPFQLEWTHDGRFVSYFRLCVGRECSLLNAVRVDGTLWRAHLPVLPQGEHQLVVEACGPDECVRGTPDLVIRVLPPAGRRPPIDVISGPRVGVGVGDR